MACPCTNLSSCGPSPRALGLLTAAAVAATLAWGASMVPGYLAGALDVLPGAYSVAEMMALRGAVAEEDIPALHAITGAGRDFDVLVAQATAGGHGSLQFAAAQTAGADLVAHR